MALQRICQSIEEQPGQEWFRLAIDRTFVVQGHGTVVTGSVTSGKLKVGDEVEWLPRGEKVRVRSLQNHDQPVEEVHRGMRAALNLAGVRHEEVVRGQELATVGYLVPSRVFTVRLHVLPEHPRPVKHRASVRFHLGTAEIMGTISLLDCDEIRPGGWGLAQVFLEEPAMAVWGQPFVIRDPAATHTLGGGQVLLPLAEKIRRRHLEVLERVEKLWTGNADERTLLVAWFSGFRGITVSDLVRGANVTPAHAQTLLERFLTEGRIQAIPLGSHKQLLLHADRVTEVNDRIKNLLLQLHEQFPLMSSHDRQKIQAQLDYLGDDALVNAVVDRLLATKVLVGDGRRIALATHKPKLSTAQKKLKEKIIENFQEAQFQPPEVSSFTNQAGGNASSLKDLFEVCTAEGHLVQLGEGLYLHTQHDATLRQRVSENLASGKGLTVAEIRDLLGTTRKFAVPICEYLDRVGVTVREGDLRFLATSRQSQPLPSS
jgi:selenocysteine-specific elongation factor